MRVFLRPQIALCALLIMVHGSWGDEPADAEGSVAATRRLEIKRFGIAIDVPENWKLVEEGRNDRAFVLQLPHEPGTRPAFAACELAIAPESLEEFQKRHEANDRREKERPVPRRKLIENDIEPIGEKRDDIAKQDNEDKDEQPRRLVSVWQYKQPGETDWFEMRVRLASHDMLYSFILSTDAENFPALRTTFERAISTAEFSAPATGLSKMPGGYWLQRDYHFALKLPPGWRPAFGPHDKVLFFATGATHEVFTDNLLVLASPAQPLDLEEIQAGMTRDIKRVDREAEVAVCEIIKQGDSPALETIIHTERGPFKITILERRFQGQKRNYEVKFTCDTVQFRREEAELRKALDSFQELQEEEGELAL